jgi:hypothetical protein
VKSKEKLKTTLKTVEAKIIARADEVKAIEKTLEEFRVGKEKQIDKKIETKASITLPHPFATTFHIFILTFTILILFPIFLISIHLYQLTMFKYSPLEISVITKHFIHGRQTQPRQRPQQKHLQALTPYDFSKFLKSHLIHALETYPGTSLFQDTYSQVKSGNLKTIFTTTYSYSTI